MGTVQDGTPDGPKLHSILVDPRDPAHLYFAMSSGGVHESLDRGPDLGAPRAGMEVVEGFDAANMTFHDPHCVRLCPSDPDRLYQQNHCGIYRIDRPSSEWVRVGRNMPKRVGDIGFPMVVHPRDADTVVGLPDGRHDRLAAHEPGREALGLRDAQRRPDLAAPRRRAARAPGVVDGQAAGDDVGRAGGPVGLYFGTTSGELWTSRDEGRRWSCIARHLPEIYAVEAAELRVGGAPMKVIIPTPLRSYTGRARWRRRGRDPGRGSSSTSTASSPGSASA